MSASWSSPHMCFSDSCNGSDVELIMNYYFISAGAIDDMSNS